VPKHILGTGVITPCFFAFYYDVVARAQLMVLKSHEKGSIFRH